MSLPASWALSHTWREAAAEHQGYGCVLPMFHGVEKQELALTARGEARTQVGPSAQTPGDGAAWTHTWPHTAAAASLPDFCPSG